MQSFKQPISNFHIPSSKPDLLVIVGPTASGKTELAIKLAEKFNGEIICADSRTVYRHLDIGTAKPTKLEIDRAPHHLLDVVDPDEPFSVADFKKLANQKINEIRSRGKLPIMVGGSGLYVDSVIFDYQFSDDGAPKDLINPRHLDSSVERKRGELSPSTLVIGLEVSRDELKQRITARVDSMMSRGFIDEVRSLLSKYPNSKALNAPGYKAFIDYINGDISLDDAKALFIKNDLNLAKRQMTWFRRNKSIHWVDYSDSVVDFVTTLMNKKQW